MSRVRWRRLFYFWPRCMRQPGNSQVLAFLSFIGCSAPSSLPHHILQLNVKFICPLSTPPPPKVADYKKIFDKFDVDSGGTIDAQELGTLIRGLGWENRDSVLSKLAKLHFRGTEKSKYWYSYQLLMKISFLDKMNIEKNINKNWRKSQYKIVLKIELKINIDIYINK